MRYIVMSVCLLMCQSAFADPPAAKPSIVPFPSPRQPMPAPLPTGGPAQLDIGKFLFLNLENYTGPVTWDFSTDGVVALLPDPPKDVAAAEYFPGIRQGDTLAGWHKIPSKTAVPCLGISNGKVTVSAWGIIDGRPKKQAELTIAVGQGPAPPPDDTLLASLKAAFALEDEDKPLLATMVVFYNKADKLVDSATTWGGLFEAMTAEAASLKIDGKLTVVQRAIQVELKNTLPWKGASDQPINSDGRKIAKAEFAKIADALTKVK